MNFPDFKEFLFLQGLIGHFLRNLYNLKNFKENQLIPKKTNIEEIDELEWKLRCGNISGLFSFHAFV